MGPDAFNSVRVDYTFVSLCSRLSTCNNCGDDGCSVDEAFAAKHMPDLGHEVKEFKVFHWRLANWKKLEKKITSPEFDCGGHRW